MKNWMSGAENSSDIVISSRIRLARNLKDKLFPHKQSIEENREIVKVVENIILSREYGFKSEHLWEKSKVWNDYYFKKHLISSKLIDNKEFSGVLINEDETVGVMINEEDHLRIQAISSGLNFQEVYTEASRYDDLLESKLDYAYDERLGYLTSCPTNLGTGMRASAMIHLPALTSRGAINSILDVLIQVGMTLRGLYGEGSRAYGNIYQISNQVTLGVLEEEILNNISSILQEVLIKEKTFREHMLNTSRVELEDKVYRSLGVLSSARIIDTKEALKLLSDVRLGVETRLLDFIDISTLNHLMVDIQASSIMNKSGESMKLKDINIKRAELLRQKLK